jgi:hypothetical protein
METKANRQNSALKMRGIVTVLMLLLCFCAKGQEHEYIIATTFGYSPEQEILQALYGDDYLSTRKGNTIAFDATFMSAMSERLYLGMGIGVRSFDLSGLDMNESNPFQKRKTRFDVHAGPSFVFPITDNLSFHAGAQGSLWFEGVGERGGRFSVGAKVMGDIVIGNLISVGIGYRPFNSKLTMTDYNFDNERIDYFLIKPTYEIRIGLFCLFDGE